MISHGDTEGTEPGFFDAPPGGGGGLHKAYLRGLRVSVANKR